MFYLLPDRSSASSEVCSVSMFAGFKTHSSGLSFGINMSQMVK